MTHRSGDGSPCLKLQTKDRLPDGSPKPTPKEKSAAEHPLRMSILQDHPVLETISGFRIILRLENAQAPRDRAVTLRSRHSNRR